jgi:hypothetical protein
MSFNSSVIGFIVYEKIKSLMINSRNFHNLIVALELLRLMIPLVDDQIILDRILPYVVRGKIMIVVD